jgi:alkanesulfonate monooxygenase SsuD/methylene tetrahydromethanopterin reductase-like flavin-dependent oxidoreductase (luciferase family)
MIRGVGGGSDPLHLGLTPWLDDWDGPADSLVEQAELTEEMGFHSFWLPESHFSGRQSNPAPLLRLAAVAARTRRLRIGTTSFLLPVRHPIHVAEEVAVLDRLSNGRLILGVGRGFRGALFAAFGVPAAEKRDRFEAVLETIREAWKGGPVAWRPRNCEQRAAEPVQLAPLPLQRPHPPIWVAAFGPKAIAQAGRLGLPYLASPVEPLSRLVENYARHHEALPGSQPAKSLPVPLMRTLFVSRDGSRVRRVREALARQAAALAAAPGIRRLATEEVDAWALAGEPGRVIDGIHRYRERLGVTHLIARTHVPGVEPAWLADSLRLLAEIQL